MNNLASLYHSPPAYSGLLASDEETTIRSIHQGRDEYREDRKGVFDQISEIKLCVENLLVHIDYEHNNSQTPLDYRTQCMQNMTMAKDSGAWDEVRGFDPIFRDTYTTNRTGEYLLQQQKTMERFYKSKCANNIFYDSYMALFNNLHKTFYLKTSHLEKPLIECLKEVLDVVNKINDEVFKQKEMRREIYSMAQELWENYQIGGVDLNTDLMMENFMCKVTRQKTHFRLLFQDCFSFVDLLFPCYIEAWASLYDSFMFVVDKELKDIIKHNERVARFKNHKPVMFLEKHFKKAKNKISLKSHALADRWMRSSNDSNTASI